MTKQVRNLYQVLDIKETIMGDLIGNGDLLKALVNQGEDALLGPTPSPDEVLHRNIHPKKRAAGLLSVDRGNITIEIKVVGTADGYYRNASVVFYVLFPETMSYITHNNKRVVREDLVAHYIDTIFDKNTGYGIGKMRFAGFGPFEAPENFDGVVLVYETIDFA